jgi:hypothetical protein
MFERNSLLANALGNHTNVQKIYSAYLDNQRKWFWIVLNRLSRPQILIYLNIYTKRSLFILNL